MNLDIEPDQWQIIHTKSCELMKMIGTIVMFGLMNQTQLDFLVLSVYTLTFFGSVCVHCSFVQRMFFFLQEKGNKSKNALVKDVLQMAKHMLK